MSKSERTAEVTGADETAIFAFRDLLTEAVTLRLHGEDKALARRLTPFDTEAMHASVASQLAVALLDVMEQHSRPGAAKAMWEAFMARQAAWREG